MRTPSTPFEASEIFVPPLPETVAGAESVRLQLVKEVLRRFGRARLRVQGTSMLPALWPGDVVEIVTAEVSRLRPGDLLLVDRDSRFFCPRFLGTVERSGRLLLRTKGDLLAREDPPVAPDAVLGRVDAVSGEARPPYWLAMLVCRVATVWPRPLTWMIQRRARHIHPDSSQ